MQQRKPFQAFTVASKGTEIPDEIYRAVGRALTCWEICETSMAQIFNKLIRPQSLSASAERIYLSSTAPSARKKMMSDVSDVYFRFFPNKTLERKIKDILDMYEDGSRRRNEIAHGFVAGHINPKYDGFSGYYLGPHFKSTKKRDLKYRPNYLITAIEINEFIKDIELLQSLSGQIAFDIVENWRSAPEAVRQRY